MSQSARIHSLSCPNCGAPLELTDYQTIVRCEFCGSHIERSDDAPTSNERGHTLKAHMVDGQIVVEQSSTARHFVIKMHGNQPVVIESGGLSADLASPVQAGPVIQTAAKGRTGGCLLTSIILIIIFVPIGFALINIPRTGRLLKLILSGDMAEVLTAVPTLNKRIYVTGSGVLVPSPSDAPPDIIVLTIQYSLDGGEQEYRLVSFNSAEPTLLWQSQPLGKDTYRVPILAGNDLVYILQEEQLMALHRADGSAAWEAELPDVVSSYLCKDCVRLLGDRLFSLCDDGTLRASDALSGAPLWDASAVQDSPRGLYVFGDRLAFMDRDENNKGLLRVFDPASGEMQTAQPTCSYGSSHLEYADWTTPLFPSPDGAGFYVIFGSPTVCAQRWDAIHLAQLWSTEMPNGADRDGLLLIGNETIYVGGDGYLLALSAATGEQRALLRDDDTPDDYDFVPLTTVGDDLLVRAARQRGSKRFELWLVDGTGSDGVRWRFDLGRNPPLDPPDANTSIIDQDEPAWTWHIAPDGLMVLRFKRADDDLLHAILIETIDLGSGTSSGSSEIPLDIDTTILSVPDFTIWRQDTLWMSIEGKLLGFDAAAGEIVYRWP
ncbi:MAG: PQQ-binding-like beta-propeller repeat protein [Anaerolineae bacterium]|nr:PQQ-binding-like beta-propeller repeat protein [Anaerolineae bacterium]